MVKSCFRFAVLLSLLFVASCTSYKRVPYLQNSEEYGKNAKEALLYEPTIKPDDVLNIVVLNTEEPSTSSLYNLIVPTDMSRSSSLVSQPMLQNYLVDANGCVNIPNVGSVKLDGLTISEAESLVLDKVKGAFTKTPVVTVRFVNYKISILGEVTSPGTYTISTGKVNIFQALALAKDLTIYGQRENVKIIREDETGKKLITELNLNDASILDSPYYYLQQNDVVYVTPNKSKAKNSDIGSSTSLWFSATSILISLTSLMYNILK